MTEIVDEKNENLNRVLENFDFSNPPIDPEELAILLVDAMRKNNGIGLAANQLGLPYRVFAMEGEPALVCFNPKIIMPGNEIVLLEEACLTFSGLYIKVKRPRDIRVRFTGPDGQVYTRTFTGMSARVFQHELDHLDGIFMHDRASKWHRDAGIKRWKKWQKNRK
jgi:peptide deformylase